MGDEMNIRIEVQNDGFSKITEELKLPDFEEVEEKMEFDPVVPRNPNHGHGGPSNIEDGECSSLSNSAESDMG